MPSYETLGQVKVAQILRDVIRANKPQFQQFAATDWQVKIYDERIPDSKIFPVKSVSLTLETII